MGNVMRKVVQTSVRIIHKVNDFENWHAVYLEKSNADSRIGVLRNIEDTNYIIIGELTKSHELAKEYYNSEYLKSAMREGGVSSEPEIRYINWHHFDTMSNDSIYRISITHEVDNFEAWKKVFDMDEARHKEGGLTLTGLGTSDDNPSEVFMMFASYDLESAKAIVNDPNLKDMMSKAGVTSEPIINYWKRF